MSRQLLEQIRKSREFEIPVDNPKRPEQQWVFTAMRPDDLEMLSMNRMTVEDQVRRCLKSIVGWKNVCEDDLVGGSNMDSVKFDSDTFCAWACTRVEIWGPVTKALFDSYHAHTGDEAAAVKN
jgi:hypothetical protein